MRMCGFSRRSRAAKEQGPVNYISQLYSRQHKGQRPALGRGPVSRCRTGTQANDADCLRPVKGQDLNMSGCSLEIASDAVQANR